MRIKSMPHSKRNLMLVALLMGIYLPAWAQTDTPTMPDMDHSSMPGMDNGTMQENDKNASKQPAKEPTKGTPYNGATTKTQPMNHDSMPGMDHSSMQGMQPNNATTDMNSMSHDSMSGMDHGSSKNMNSGDGMGGMNMDYSTMQGGAAPADARDPNAYSDGYTLDSGPYALPGPRQLRMADEHNFASLLVDRFEAVHTHDNNSAAYSLQAWYGRDYDRAMLKAEGVYDNRQLEEANTELFWSHALATYWNRQLGMRYDSGDGPNRTWLAMGVQGLAPYWFEIDAMAYIGEQGRTALKLESEYEVLFTQKLILQPRIEINAYGKNDDARGIGSGLSELTAGLRLRYEFRREFAPYVGIEWTGKFGNTASIARDAGQNSKEIQLVAGVRFWF